MKEEKQQIANIDRSVYDIKDREDDFYKIDAGLTPALVEQISKEKNDPEWMKEFRLHSLEIYNKLQVPDWGPSIEGLHMDQIVTYVRPNTKMKGDWSEVPEDIKNTFERRQNGNHWLALVHSMTLSWFIIMCGKKSQRWALSIPIWKVQCMANMRK